MDEIEKETTRPTCVEKPASRENPLGNRTDGGLPAHHALDALFLSQITETLGMPAGTPATLLGAGQNNLVYDVGGELVRLPRHATAENELEREARVLAVLKPLLPAPIPALRVCRSGQRVFSVHPRIQGEPLSTLRVLTAEQQRGLAADLGGFLRALHAVPAALLPDLAEALPSMEWDDLRSRCEALAFPLLAPRAVSRLRRAFDDFLAVCDALPRSVLHGDFGTGNILIHEGRLSGVIDFSGCDLGDEAYDYASLAAGLGDAFVDTMLNRFQMREGFRDRMRFYRLTFPLLDILHGVEHGDRETLHAGVEAFSETNLL